MSWMDSWSRPSKSQATPPPFYLLPGGDKTPYCRSCGRVIGDRKTKTATTSGTPAKYCSSRCKTTRHNTKIDHQIEDTFVALLNGEVPPETEESSISKDNGSTSSKKKQKKKGESRILVDCTAVETIVFGERNDPDKRFGRRKNRAQRGVKDGEVWKTVDMVSDAEDGLDEEELARVKERLASGVVARTPKTKQEDAAHNAALMEAREDSSNSEDDENTGGVAVESKTTTTEGSNVNLDPDVVARLSIRSGTRIRPSQQESEVNGGVGGEKGVKERILETEDMLTKRRIGQRKADERELVRCAARRGVAFGFVTAKRGEEGEERRLCEAVMQGSVVESSFAKGEWGVRWRE